MSPECVECGSVLGDYEQMCSECATPAPGAKPRAPILQCTACGITLPKESAFCLACGAPVAKPHSDTAQSADPGL